MVADSSMGASTSFIAVDLGAQSGRVVVGTFGPDGFSLVEAHRFANVPNVIDGTLCWDVEWLFDETLQGLAIAVNRIHDDDSTVAGIAVDSWGVDYGLVDASGGLVAPVRHYRANPQHFMDLANERVPQREAYLRTGVIGLSINTNYQLVRDAEMGLLDTRPTVLLTPDLWTFWLTGSRGAERTIASTTGLMDRRRGAWAQDLMDRWRIPIGIVPELVATGSLAGVTTPDVTQRIGAVSPVRVFRAPAHDTASAFAAVVSPGDDAAVISCGTWALVGAGVREPVLTEEAMEAGFTNEVGAEDSTVFIRNLNGTWLLDECLREWSEADSRVDVASLRADLLAAATGLPESSVAIDPGASELIEHGRMSDRIVDLYRRAGGSGVMTRAEVVRLILDSLALSFAATVTTAGRLTGVGLERIHMIGGGSQIDLLVRLTERASGLPVLVGHSEATSIGNVCAQAVAAGVFANLPAARRAAAMMRPSASSNHEGGVG
jgi:rhamnulokinase